MGSEQVSWSLVAPSGSSVNPMSSPRSITWGGRERGRGGREGGEGADGDEEVVVRWRWGWGGEGVGFDSVRRRLLKWGGMVVHTHMKQGGQVMVAVLTPPHHTQEQVDLRKKSPRLHG